MKPFSLNLSDLKKKEETPVGGMKLNLSSLSSNETSQSPSSEDSPQKNVEKKFSLDLGKMNKKDNAPPQKSPAGSGVSSPQTSERTIETLSTSERTNEEQIVFVPKISMLQMKVTKFAEKTTEKKKIRIDLLFSDLCTEFEIEGDITNENLKPHVEKAWFGDDKKEFDFEFYELSKVNSEDDEDDEIYHIACKPLHSDFSVKLLKNVLHQNKILKTKLEKSSEAIRTLSNERTSAPSELSTDVVALREKIKNYENLMSEASTQLQKLRKNADLLDKMLNQ